MIGLGVASILLCTSMDYAPGKWGCEIMEKLRREFYDPMTKLYVESLTPKRSPAFNWSVGVMISALNAASRFDAQYKPWLREYVDASRVYWNPAPPVAGYDVLPLPKQVDRYYDDNAWMCLALIEAHEILGDEKYLRWAKEAYQYTYSGWTDALGGGIFWRESKKESKNTCSNAPAILCAYKLAKILSDKSLAIDGDRIFEWTYAKLRDPSDELYWDAVSLTGQVAKTKWSYNSALMIRSALERSRQSDDEASAVWLKRAKDSLGSSLTMWIDSDNGAIKDEACFAHLLFEAIVEMQREFRDEKLAQAVRQALTFLREKNRDANGHYGKKWNVAASKPYSEPRLIDQASAARALFLAALAK